jgi:hypothetical protein
MIPRKYNIIGTLKALYHHPIYIPVGIIFSYVFSKVNKIKPIRTSAVWEISTSSKRPITQKELSIYQN